MSEHIQHITDAEWDEKVLGADTPVLVDYWAEWCGAVQDDRPHPRRHCRGVRGAGAGLQDRHRRQSADAAQVRHPGHPHPDAVPQRRGGSHQGGCPVEVAARSILRQQHLMLGRCRRRHGAAQHPMPAPSYAAQPSPSTCPGARCPSRYPHGTHNGACAGR